MGLLWTFLAFALALGVLIVFHELGHYAVARAAGVKVLRFSVGFGTPLLVRRLGRDRTEWALSAFPLGGYVKMLDEREGPVAVEERHRAFNRQPVGKRFAIVLAGPLANFVLAVLLYWILYLHGVPGLRPLIGEAPAGSAAAAAQLAGGDEILRVGDKPVATWQDLRWELLDHAVRRDTVTLEVRGAKGDLKFPRLDLSRVRNEDIDKDLLAAIGLTRYTPPMRPVIGRLIEGGAGKRDGLQEGDLVLAIGGRPVEQWEQLVEAVRASPGKALSFEVERGGRRIAVVVNAQSATEDGKTIGRIGAAPKVDEKQIDRLLTEVRYAPLAAAAHAVQRTSEVSLFTLKMLGRMLIGEVSLRNLSGPITIADYAGQSAQLGWLAYLNFLALISVSLGVLNLLPVPVLDGGHLMYYLVELAKGSPVSDRAMEVGQQVGIVLLFSLMAFALYNDINRLFGG
ncbi:MAG TPA: RIP metalloprotease RseP [Burkholderiales bacterium]|nr:RIP metalloprotease RseP [Burkholderiales bacterium]